MAQNTVNLEDHAHASCDQKKKKDKQNPIRCLDFVVGSEMTEIACNHLKKDYHVQSEMAANITHAADLIA